MSIAFDDFDILNPKLVNGTVIEASAGTGKTFSVASIVTRAIALDENVRKQWAESIPLKRGGSPEDVANVCLFLASDMSGYVTGQTLSVCGGMLM